MVGSRRSSQPRQVEERPTFASQKQQPTSSRQQEEQQQAAGERLSPSDHLGPRQCPKASDGARAHSLFHLLQQRW